MIDIKWYKGAPDELLAGMVIRVDALEGVHLVGSGSQAIIAAVPLGASITSWAWIIQPYELNWIGEKCKL